MRLVGNVAVWMLCIPPLPSVCLSAGAPGETGGADTSVAVLDAAVEEWRFAVEFRSHYRYRQGWAASREKGLRGEFGAALGEGEDSATGVFHKSGKRIRFSVDFGAAPDDASAKHDGSVVTNISRDGVTWGQLDLVYYPKYGTFGDTATITERLERDLGRLEGGPGDMPILNPFSFGGGVNGSPLKSYAAKPGYEETLERSVIKPDSEHIAVVMLRKGKKGYRTLRRVTFWTLPSPPVIDRVETVYDHPERNKHFETATVGSGFVACGGGTMARCVREVSGPEGPGGSSSLKWVVKEWVSEDLGKRLPSDDDFVVTIPPSTRVNGLKHPPFPGASRKLDLGKHSVEDLRTSHLPVMPGEAGAQAASRLGQWRWVLALGTFGLLLMLIVILWRRGRTSGPA